MSEIKRTNKDNFWAQAEKDEEKRRQEEKKKAEEERQQMEKERKDREAKEAALREKAAKERASQIDDQRRYQQQLESQQKKQQEEEEPAARPKGYKRAESVEKANEAAALISQRSVNPREMFQQREKGIAASSTDNTPSSPQPGRLKSPFLSKQPYEPEPSRSPVHQASPVRATETRVVESHTDYEEADADAEYEDVGVVSDQYSSHVEQQQHEAVTEPENLYEEPQEVEEQNLYEDSDTGDRGTCARALYDYQAADDTEISFDPDDIITGIEMIDEGWWRGYSPDGHFGMFPANYVELL
ncbi:hypothetical protein PDJAM_G00246680 [Pangasius djambal]|uniref:Uncharacterized protein n=1 Tax=Pangasius djambal TaxID=1691987 RepID=A0ACC5YIA2_9TELE|nr:hypothetical protein [Pangasius djambal]